MRCRAPDGGDGGCGERRREGRHREQNQGWGCATRVQNRRGPDGGGVEVGGLNERAWRRGGV